MRPAALKLVFLLIQFLLFRVCLSQVYPVQLSTQLLPPYSSYLPDYGDPTNEKLKCILVLQDFSVTHRDVRLEISITGNGFSIHTNPTFIPSAITLTPGNPVLITGTDLAPYLETSHLIFTGINAADYELEKILPEGHYSICIRAYDYYNPSPTQISNESCNYAWFFLNDPPYLNFPACETEITPVTPQNIIFQWTAMNLNSPNSSFNTEYDFELFELRPNNGIPNNVVQNSAPVFSTTTTNPFFQYGITEPTLYLGMNYVWRVRARDLSGRDLFKNDGWSQICTFTYGNINSAFPSGSFTLTANSTASTHRQGKIWWNHIANFSQYHLQIRKVGTENWFDYYTTTPELKVNELEPSTAYEARVMGTGNNLESAWSNTTAFTTPPQPQFGCNDQTQPINALSANPLTLATAGMIFQIGQFEMIATQITPDPRMPGYFSGYGKVMMYALNIGVQYHHVYINDNLQITSGNLIALTEGIDQWEADWMVHQAINNAVWIDGLIDDVYVSDSLIYVITDDGDTLTYEFPDEGPLVINDEEGNQYIVYPDGTVVEGSWLDYSNDHLDCNADNKVVFSKYEEQLYGFDQYEHPQWAEDFEAILLSDSTNYFVANKSLKEGGDDYVWAAFANENLPLSTLTFKTSAGETLTYEISGNKIKLHLQNISDGESVYAMANEQRLGKLNVRVYAEEEKKLVLVPVGNAALPDENTLRHELNKIFGQGVMRFTVSSAAAFTNTAWDTNGDGLLAAGNHGALQDYSEEMKNLSSAWLHAHETDKDAFVLFVIPGFDAENVDKGGYMPLGRHKGFIKTGSDLKVYLHEIGHGTFGLEHTFPEVAESSTNNLMDYSGGKDLRTLQWKIMRQDWSHFSLLDDEDDGSYYANSNLVIPEVVDFDELLADNSVLTGPENTDKTAYMLNTGHILVLNTEVTPRIDSRGFLNAFVTNSGKEYTHLAYANKNIRTVFFDLEKFKELDSKPETAGNFTNDGIISAATLELYKNFALPVSAYRFAQPGDKLYTKLLLSDEQGNCSKYEKQFEITGAYLSTVKSKVSETHSLTWSQVEGKCLDVFPLPDENTNYVLNNLLNTAPAYQCEIQEIYRNNGEGKIFLARELGFIDKNDAETMQALVDAAKQYDEFGAKLMNEAKNSDYLYMIDEAMKGIEYRIVEVEGQTKHSKAYYESLKSAVSTYYQKLAQVESQLMSLTEQDRLMEVLDCFYVPDYSIFSMDFRIRLLKTISSERMRGNTNLMGGDEESEALRLFSEIKKEEIPEFHRRLMSETYEGKTLLYRFDYEFNDAEYIMGDGNYGKLMGVLIDQCVKAQSGSINVANLVSSDNPGSILNFGYKGLEDFYYDIDNASISPTNGNITLNYNLHCPPMVELALHITDWIASLTDNVHAPISIDGQIRHNAFTYHPFKDWVVIIPNKTIELDGGNIVFEVGKPYVLPAIGARYLYRQRANEANQQNFRLAVNVASLAIGGAGISGSTGVMRVLAWIDVASTAADLTFDIFDEELKTLLGEEVYEDIRSGLIITQLAGMGGMGLIKVNQYLNKFPTLANRIKSLDVSEISQDLALSSKKDDVIETVNEIKRVIGMVEEVSESLSSNFSKQDISVLNGFSDNIDDLVAQQGIDINTFKELQQKTYDELTLSERSVVLTIRNSVPSPDANTIMQKVIPKGDIVKFISGERTSCRGFISTASDSKHLNSFTEIFEGMRLDYPGTAFNLNDGSCGVIRFQASNSSSAYPPINLNSPDAFPFTNHGFTSAKGGLLGVPEWKMDVFADLDNGAAEIWEVFSDGTEILRGKYDNILHRFVPIN